MIHDENAGDFNAAKFAEDVSSECTFCKGKGFVLKEGSARHCNACNGTGVRGGKAQNIPHSVWHDLTRPNREEYI